MKYENSAYAIALIHLNAIIVCQMLSIPKKCGTNEISIHTGPYNAYLFAALVNARYGSLGISIGITT